MRTMSRGILGSRKRKKVSSKSRGVKIKLKIKSKSPEGLANAVGKLAGSLGPK